MRAVAAKWEERRLVVHEECLESELASGRHSEVVDELTALVNEHPLREVLRGQLMLAPYRCGRQADALGVFREGRDIMISQLGIEPGLVGVLLVLLDSECLLLYIRTNCNTCIC